MDQVSMPRSPLFLSVPDAARLLGVSPERLQRAIRDHQVPAITIGARRLVSRRVLEKLADLDDKESA
jgi:excisionase family DNA binding protein